MREREKSVIEHINIDIQWTYSPFNYFTIFIIYTIIFIVYLFFHLYIRKLYVIRFSVKLFIAF